MNSPNFDMLQALVLSTFSSVLQGGKATYCSTPITTGRRFVTWIMVDPAMRAARAEWSDQLKSDYDSAVVAANCEHAQRVIESLRKESGLVVIDPTRLPSIPGWSQQDWLSLWTTVIRRFASEVVFLDDWQFSNGCVAEFAVAHSLGLPTWNEAGEPLTIRDAVVLIEEAVETIAIAGASTSDIAQTLSVLRTTVQQCTPR